MTTINDQYINALLADATYASDLRDGMSKDRNSIGSGLAFDHFFAETENDAIQNLANGSVGFESDKATGRILGAGIY